jgi:hypothetical protein
LTDKEDIDNFLSLYNDEFAETVGSIARHTLTENKYNKKVLLPLTEDLVKYMVSKSASQYQSMDCLIFQKPKIDYASEWLLIEYKMFLETHTYKHMYRETRSVLYLRFHRINIRIQKQQI